MTGPTEELLTHPEGPPTQRLPRRRWWQWRPRRLSDLQLGVLLSVAAAGAVFGLLTAFVPDTGGQFAYQPGIPDAKLRVPASTASQRPAGPTSFTAPQRGTAAIPAPSRTQTPKFVEVPTVTVTAPSPTSTTPTSTTPKTSNSGGSNDE